jgi:hypothetical protein
MKEIYISIAFALQGLHPHIEYDLFTVFKLLCYNGFQNLLDTAFTNPSCNTCFTYVENTGYFGSFEVR